MEELKACFVCGEKTQSHTFTWTTVPQVSCNNRHCIIYGLWFTEEDWNKSRPLEDALQAENARLREALEEIAGMRFDTESGGVICNIAEKALKGGE